MSLVILLVILFVIIVLIAVILVLNNYNPIIEGTEGGVLIPTDACQVSSEVVPDLTFNPCCEIFGRSTNTRYLSTLNIVVSPVAIPYLDVCAGFCAGGYDRDAGRCRDLGPNIPSGQEQFDACELASAPVDCSDPAKPVAISQTQLLYPFSAGNLLCQTTSVCGIS